MTPNMSSVLIKLAGLIATVATGGLLFTQNYLYRGGIDKRFDGVDKKLDAVKAELKDDIKHNRKICTEHNKKIEEDFRKVSERVAFTEGEVKVVRGGMYRLMKAIDRNKETAQAVITAVE